MFRLRMVSTNHLVASEYKSSQYRQGLKRPKTVDRRRWSQRVSRLPAPRAVRWVNRGRGIQTEVGTATENSLYPSFNPLNRGRGIQTALACNAPTTALPSFNPLNRGRGIQTLIQLMSNLIGALGFNPLNRGRGVQNASVERQHDRAGEFQSS